MSDDVPARRPRRLLVGLDASVPSVAALEAAAALAARIGADIEGLFVEDEDVARLAALSVGRFVDAWSAATRNPGADEVDAAFRAAAARARSALSEAARRERVRWTFRVVRGRVPAELLAAADAADMVCVGCTSRPQAPAGRMGRTARALVEDAPARVSVVAVVAPDGGPAEARRIAAPFVVLHDGSEAARRALVTAARLARHGEAVALAVPRGDADVRRTALRDAEEILGAGPPPAVVELRGASPAAVAEAVHTAGGRTLVVPGTLADAAGARLGDVLAGLLACCRCVILVAR